MSKIDQYHCKHGIMDHGIAGCNHIEIKGKTLLLCDCQHSREEIYNLQTRKKKTKSRGYSEPEQGEFTSQGDWL